jgi:hypothetical protein
MCRLCRATRPAWRFCAARASTPQLLDLLADGLTWDTRKLTGTGDWSDCLRDALRYPEEISARTGPDTPERLTRAAITPSAAQR